MLTAMLFVNHMHLCNGHLQVCMAQRDTDALSLTSSASTRYLALAQAGGQCKLLEEGYTRSSEAALTQPALQQLCGPIL